MRRIDVLAVLLMLALAVNSFVLSDDEPETPFRKQERTPPIVVKERDLKPKGPELPAPDLDRDPQVFIKPDTKRANSTGTAFSIDDDGYWLTARHVVRACDRVLLVIDQEERRALRVVDVSRHPVADVALLRTRDGPPALRLGERALSVGEHGYGLGYPKGEPGDVSGSLMGRASLKVVGRNDGRSPLLVWSEKRRRPDKGGSLGGLSGGPMLDANGEIVGVVVAESARRGRVMTADLRSTRELFRQVEDAPDFQTAFDGAVTAGIGPNDFHDMGNRLRETLTVAQVVCLVD